MDIDRPYTPIARVEQPGRVKLFTEKGTAVATAIGGPLAGAYLIARNFRSLGKKHAARLTLIIGGAFTIALFTTLALLPLAVVDKIPRELLPLGYGLIGYLVVKSLQQQDINTHLQAGGKKGSWQVIVGSGLVSLALSLGYFFTVVMFTPSQRQVLTEFLTSSRQQPSLDEFEITVHDIPKVFDRVKAHAENETFVVFVFAPAGGRFPEDAINIEFYFEEGRIGLDWVLLGAPNIKDKEKFEQLASSLRYKLVPKRKNGVNYLRAEEGDLPQLCERAICDLYSLRSDSKIGLLLHGIPWP